MTPVRWLSLLCVLALAVLAFSQIVTDRFGAIQFLWWVPRIFLGMPAIVGFAMLLFWSMLRRGSPRERREIAVGLGASLLLTAWCMASDWGVPRSRPDGAFRFAHWNACSVNRTEAPRAVDAILAFEADAVLLTDPGAVFSEGGAERLQQTGYEILLAGPFAIVSRVPVLEARPIYRNRGRALSRFVLETPLGRLTLDAVDLPSETTLPRRMSMRNFVAEVEPLRGAGADLVVGDFNITRGSGSLSLLAPGATEAFATSGVGWGGTYPREWPFLAIDQTLVQRGWRAQWARIVDPGLTRHRAQLVDLIPAR